jgi:hypothetical protein
LKPIEVKGVQLKPVNKAETVPFSAEKATPVAAADVRISSKTVAGVKANSVVRVTRAISIKPAAKVPVAAEPTVPQKPVAAQPDDKL